MSKTENLSQSQMAEKSINQEKSKLDMNTEQENSQEAHESLVRPKGP